MQPITTSHTEVTDTTTITPATTTILAPPRVSYSAAPIYAQPRVSYVAPLSTYVSPATRMSYVAPITTYISTPVTTAVQLPMHATTISETMPRVGRTSYTTNLYPGGSYVSGARNTTGSYIVPGSGLSSSYSTGVYPGSTYISSAAPQIYAPATSVYDNYNLGYRSYNTGSTLGSYGIGYTSALPATATYGGYGMQSSSIGGYGAGYGSDYAFRDSYRPNYTPSYF